MKMGIVSFLVGVLFSLGLGLSGMTDPDRVLGFLDVTGKWDPTLLFVMGSAIPVYFVFWYLFNRRGKPLLDATSHVPSNRTLDRKLILGSALFGVGWGVAGVCPGPGIAATGAMSGGVLVFLVGFFVGSRIESAVDQKL